ncbi:diguanylate cyclase [Aliiglaciecola sp. CAU 1673]|uniref:sensor domain-containing diguanylate cyclase n=1 Tax=Aliiglaciecola sp. CAU 1673 TaxID=3032595 RepID=UPI0023DA95BB|nr:sensor domain-containing diguanylate cyclase [Aliiglaciecola sp. CAU 1673]MDF2180302.1 diguanylate cyclase [Aliiglaciecola sp. CAU 1673]
MISSTESIAEQLLVFVHQSQDGYAIYCADDSLLYANDAFRQIFCIPADYQGLSFDDVIRLAHQQKYGIKIDADDIDSWLSYAHSRRRSRPFRLFEVDMEDGRWYLFSEQVGNQGDLLVQAKDITKQKLLENQLQKMALTDPLTGIANRRCFVDSVASELSRCRREQQPVSLLLLDLDHFKQVNDNYGHQVGDEALKSVSKTIRETLRQYDIFGRIGGEEFAVFLGNTGHEQAMEIAQRLCEAVSAQAIIYEKGQFELTTSIGITTVKDEANFEQLYLEADEALYHAKESGRNRVVAFGMPA